MTTQFARLLALDLDIRPEEQLLEADVCTIGRAPTCQITVPRNIVSRVHARIERDGLRYMLYDAGSADETFPSLTVISMVLNVPTLDDEGVPDRRPVDELNPAQPGLFLIVNCSVSPFGSLAVGVNEYD